MADSVAVLRRIAAFAGTLAVLGLAAPASVSAEPPPPPTESRPAHLARFRREHGDPGEARWRLRTRSGSHRDQRMGGYHQPVAVIRCPIFPSCYVRPS